MVVATGGRFGQLAVAARPERAQAVRVAFFRLALDWAVNRDSSFPGRWAPAVWRHRSAWPRAAARIYSGEVAAPIASNGGEVTLFSKGHLVP